MSRTKLLAATALMALLTGCAVGPDFDTPPAPNAASYSPDGMPAGTDTADIAGGAAQKFVPGGPIPSEWWELYHSDPLIQLVIQALNNNPNLQAAQATLRAAQENVYASDSAFLPSLDGQATVTRTKPASVPFKLSPYSLFNASVNVAYTLDVFGGIRRAVEETQAERDYYRYERDAAYLSLTANVVTAAIQEASLRGQIAATEDIIGVNRHSLDLVQAQFNLGSIAKSTVLTQAANLAQAEATLPPLQKQLAQIRHQLLALLGQLPSDKLEAAFDLNTLTLPGELPVSLPSALVAQRPDIKAAEAQLHQASAAIGVSIANALPQFSLTGSFGDTSGKLASLLNPSSAVWNLGAGLTQPLFHGGEFLHRYRQAEATYDATAAQYRATVIAAFQNVADVLQAIQSDAATLKASLAAERAAADSLALSQDQYKLGAIGYLQLLTAEQTYQSTRIALVQAQAARFADTAALFQALGGGWQDKDIPDTSRDLAPTVPPAPPLPPVPPQTAMPATPAPAQAETPADMPPPVAAPATPVTAASPPAADAAAPTPITPQENTQ